jgi:hypothetical protein
LYPYPLNLGVRGENERSYLPADVFGAETGIAPARIEYILFAEYQPEAVWNPQPVTPAQTAFRLLENVFYRASVRRKPSETLNAVTKLANHAKAFEGFRSDTSSVIGWIEEKIDEKDLENSYANRRNSDSAFDEPKIPADEDLRKSMILIYKVMELHLAKAARKLSEAGIEYVLIKGWAASQAYPDRFERALGDFDFCVAPEQYEKALGFAADETFKNVDFHKGLRHLDTISWSDLYENAVNAVCAGENIKIPRPEDHLRILCVHWLTDGGINRRRLWDIYYCFRSNLTDFDWDRCLNSVEKNRRGWIICTLGLTEKYLSVTLDGTPFESKKIRIPKWVSDTVEKEWADGGTALVSLSECFKNRKEFFRQLKKRFPPNPIQSVIDLEGDLDTSVPVFYQIGDMFFRLLPFLKRLWARL